MPQNILPLLLELGGEAAAGSQEEVGSRLFPEGGALVVEEERSVGGEGGGQGEGGAHPTSQIVPRQDSFGDPGQGEQEEGAEDLQGGRLVRMVVHPLHDRSHQAVDGPGQDRSHNRHGQVDEHAHQAPHDEADGGGQAVGGSHLVVPQVEGVEEGVVLADGFDHGGGALGVAVPQVPVAGQEGAADGDTLGEPPPSGRLGVPAVVEVRGSRGEPGVLPGVVVEGDVLQGRVDAGGEGAEGRHRVPRGQVDFRRRVDRLPHLDESAGAEGLLGVEEQAHGHDADIQTGILLFGFEDDAGGARLERLQGGIVVARPLRKQGERSSPREQVVGAVEGLHVAGHVRALVLPAVDGDGARELEERPEGQDLPQGALAQEAGQHRQRPQQQQGIDEPVDVVRHQHQGTVARNALLPHHLHLAEEDLEDQAGDATHEAVGGGEVGHREGVSPGRKRLHPGRSRPPCQSKRSSWPGPAVHRHHGRVSKVLQTELCYPRQREI